MVTRSIIDTDYGVGAYKISGGASGGFILIFLGLVMLFAIAIFLLLSGPHMWAFFLGPGQAVLSFYLSSALSLIASGLGMILKDTDGKAYDAACTAGGGAVGAGGGYLITHFFGKIPLVGTALTILGSFIFKVC